MENKNNNNNNEIFENKSKYQDSTGTGVLGAIIFMIVIFIGMFLLSKYMG